MALLLRWIALLLLVCACSSTPEQRRAVSVAQCIAGVAATLPVGSELPLSSPELTNEDLDLALALVRGVRQCRQSWPSPDAGG